jgi:hypothetical protein
MADDVGMPRWVKIFIVAGVVAVVAFVVIHLAGVFPRH